MKKNLLLLVLLSLSGIRLLAGGWGTAPPSSVTVNTAVGGATAWGTSPSSPGYLLAWYKDNVNAWHSIGVIYGGGSSGSRLPSTGFANVPSFTPTATGTYTLAIYSSSSGTPGSSPAGTVEVQQAITVNPATTPITAATIAPVTYNGTAQLPSAVSSVTPSGAMGSVTVTATAAQTNAGTYTTGKVTGTGSYSGTLSNLSWTINKANQTVAISPTSYTLTTGSSLSFTASGGVSGTYNWGGTSGATGTGTTKSVTFGTAGTYTVTVQDPGNANYNASNVATATIVVDTLPSITGSYAPTTINFGQSSTVTYAAIQNSAPVTGLSAMYAIGGTQQYATVPGFSYTLTPSWPTSYPNDTTFTYSSLSSTSDVSPTGASVTKTFVVTPKAPGTYGAFAIWAWDSSWAGASGSGTATGLIVNKANPNGTYANATKLPQSGAIFTVAASDLNAAFSNPYSGSVTAPTGTVTYAIAPGSPSGTVGSAVIVGTTFSGGLTYVIRATYPGDTNYNSATADSTWTISGDNDGDGVPNEIEAQLGTNPNSAAQGDAGNTQLKVTKPQQ